MGYSKYDLLAYQEKFDAEIQAKEKKSQLGSRLEQEEIRRKEEQVKIGQAQSEWRMLQELYQFSLEKLRQQQEEQFHKTLEEWRARFNSEDLVRKMSLHFQEYFERLLTNFKEFFKLPPFPPALPASPTLPTLPVNSSNSPTPTASLDREQEDPPPNLPRSRGFRERLRNVAVEKVLEKSIEKGIEILGGHIGVVWTILLATVSFLTTQFGAVVGAFSILPLLLIFLLPRRMRSVKIHENVKKE